MFKMLKGLTFFHKGYSVNELLTELVIELSSSATL